MPKVKNYKGQRVAKFQQGILLRSGGNVVLVTGPGNWRAAGYPCFAGTVVMQQPSEEDDAMWPVGFHSDTWNKEAFRKVNLNMNNLMKQNIKP